LEREEQKEEIAEMFHASRLSETSIKEAPSASLEERGCCEGDEGKKWAAEESGRDGAGEVEETGPNAGRGKGNRINSIKLRLPTLKGVNVMETVQ